MFEAIGFIVIALVVAAIIAYTNKERDKIEKRIDNLILQKDALAKMILFLIKKLPDEDELFKDEEDNFLTMSRRGEYSYLTEDIKSVAEDVVVGYINDEELEKKLIHILIKTGDLTPIR